MMNDNDEILASLERVVAEMKRKRYESKSKKMDTRNDEIRRLRFDEGWTNTRIGEKFGISRERVRQIIGNTGNLAHKMRMDSRSDYILSQPHKTNGELSEELGVGRATISGERSHVRHAIEFGTDAARTGFAWEEWAHDYLFQNGIDNVLQNFRAPYDIIALDNVFIDVKVATKPCQTSPFLKSTQYHFQPNNRHNEADIYMLIIGPTEDVFIVPAKKIENMGHVYFCWPSKRPEIGKLQKYHNRLDLIWSIHEQKRKEN